MINKVFIYVLIDPITNQVRYVGKTTNLKQRYNGHLSRHKDTNTHRRNWINKLAVGNLKPIMEVVDEVTVDSWQYWEKFWISYFKYLGAKLVNAALGGEGLSFGNQTSFKKGQIPYNKGAGHSSTCQVCSKIFYHSPCKNQKTCSIECVKIYNKTNPKMVGFKKGHKAWHAGTRGLHPGNRGYIPTEEVKNKIRATLTGRPSLKKRKVKQFDNSMNLVAEFESITEAIQITGFIGIPNVLTGRAKKAGGFLWQ